MNVLPPYDLIDIGLTAPFGMLSSRIQLDVAVTNLLDERAALLADYPLPGRGWSVRLRVSP